MRAITSALNSLMGEPELDTKTGLRSSMFGKAITPVWVSADVYLPSFAVA
jgi:hypothetical protein